MQSKEKKIYSAEVKAYQCNNADNLKVKSNYS